MSLCDLMPTESRRWVVSLSQPWPMIILILIKPNGWLERCFFWVPPCLVKTVVQHSSPSMADHSMNSTRVQPATISTVDWEQPWHHCSFGYLHQRIGLYHCRALHSQQCSTPMLSLKLDNRFHHSLGGDTLSFVKDRPNPARMVGAL